MVNAAYLAGFAHFGPSGWTTFPEALIRWRKGGTKGQWLQVWCEMGHEGPSILGGEATQTANKQGRVDWDQVRRTAQQSQSCNRASRAAYPLHLQRLKLSTRDTAFGDSMTWPSQDKARKSTPIANVTCSHNLKKAPHARNLTSMRVTVGRTEAPWNPKLQHLPWHPGPPGSHMGCPGLFGYLCLYQALFTVAPQSPAEVSGVTHHS